MSRTHSIESEKHTARFSEMISMDQRMRTLIYHGNKALEGSSLLTDEPVAEEGVADAYRLLREVAQFAHPNALPSFWEHQFAAPHLGREIAQQLAGRGVDINPNEIEVTMIVHDLARLVIPHRYGFNDTVNHHMLVRMGLSRFLDNLVPIEKVLRGTITPEELTIAQMVTDIADNLGKRTANGELFTSTSWEQYLNVHTNHYNKVAAAHWLIEHRSLEMLPEGVEHQKQLVRHSLTWLAEHGVDIDAALEATKPIAPGILHVVRHGDTDNEGKLYNWDFPNHQRVGITEKGHNQLQDMGDTIAKRRNVTIHRVFSSDLHRAQESARTLVTQLIYNGQIENGAIVIDPRLRDVYAEVVLGLWSTMESFQQETGGNIYTPHLLAQGVEPLHVLQARMLGAVRDALSHRQDNGSFHGILVSHGDAIRVLLDAFDKPGHIPTHEDYDRYRKEHYVNKGEGWEIIIDPWGNYLTRNRLPDPYKVAERDY